MMNKEEGRSFHADGKRVSKPTGEKRHRIFVEYTEFPNNLSIEQVKEMMKADSERQVEAYNSVI